MRSDIAQFLAGDVFAVAGASNDRSKFGNKVLRCYWRHDRVAYPLNPLRDTVEGQPCFASVADTPRPVHGLSLVTPPPASLEVIRQAAAAGVRHVWFQPGAESPEAVALARESGMNTIADGSCLLVELG